MPEFQFDEVDQQLLDGKKANREQIEGPRLGDFVRFPSGEVERLSLKLAAGFQTAPGWAGSYFLHQHGEASFSGSHNPAVPLDSLSLTSERADGEFWFFHHDEAGAGRSVRFSVPCRVFKTGAPYKGYITKF